MKSFFGNIIFYTLIYFIFLFDKDGAQLGLSLFPNIADGWIQTASILGNVLWLLGVIFLIGGIALFAVSFDDSIICKTIKESTKEKMEIITERPNMFLVPVGVFTVMFGIGSGFWFTGISWLIMLAGAYTWRYVITQAYEEYLKEKGETRTDSAEDELKKSLLD